MTGYAVEDVKRMIELLAHIYDIIDDLVAKKYVPYYKWAITEMKYIIRRENKIAVSFFDNAGLCPLCRQEIKAESIDNMFYCPNCGQRIDVIINKIPEKLYGIKNTNTGEIVFNARGVPYHTYDAALKRLRQLDEDKYTIVIYKISDNN